MRFSNFLIRFTCLLWLNVNGANSKIGYFWHITDLHYDPFHNSPDFTKGCHHNHNGKKEHIHRNGRHRTDHTCDSSWSLIQSAAGFMAERHPETLEFVLWTGDILSSSMEHLSDDIKLEAVRNVTDILSRTFSSQFVFPALGHNDPPISRKLVDMWMHWLPTEALVTFELGGYYTIEQSRSKLQIVVLNSNLWAGGGTRTDAPHRGRSQWEWLDQVLSKARRKNEMVYLVAHAGPGVEERHNSGSSSAAGGGELTPLANSRLLHLIRAYSDVIAGQFYGHRHADTFRLVYGIEGKPVSWTFLAPSLTPRGAGSISNPGLRLYKFESNSGKVLDYTQYYLDVTSSKSEPHWAIEYNLTQHYGLREVSPSSLDALAERIRNSHDRGVLGRYLSALRVRQHTDVSECDPACAHVHFCAITRADYQDFRSCVRNPASALASRANQHSLAAILFSAILILFCTY